MLPTAGDHSPQRDVYGMLQPLLERESILERLLSAFDQATRGAGACVLIRGEAGIGKTALVEELARRVGSRSELMSGACDALDTPRPLGPLVDFCDRLSPGIRAMLEDFSSGPSLFHAIRSALAERASPVLLIFEDIHWADESTRDLIRFLARRIGTLKVLMVVTYRTEGGSDVDPLRVLLGDLIGPRILRVDVAPLSKEAVQTLAASCRADHRDVAVDAHALHRLTGGNPFFVTEVLANPAVRLPDSVRDATVARLLRLPGDLQHFVRIVSLAPQRCDHDLFSNAFPVEHSRALTEMAHGKYDLLIDDGVTIGFRHELARLAVAESVAAVSPAAARAWHRRFLGALESRTGSALALLAHHAAGSGDSALIVRWALPAGIDAMRLGANREAVRLLGAALAASEGRSDVDRVSLHEQYAQCCQASLDLPEAIRARCTVIDECSRNGWAVREGKNLALLGRVHWLAGDRSSAMSAFAAALSTLQSHDTTVEYAWACALIAGAHMTSEEDTLAIEFATRALRTAERLNALEVRIHALNTLGDAQQYREVDWRTKLEESLRLSLAHGYPDHAARAYINLASTSVVAQDFRAARVALADGLAFASEHDLDFQRDYLLAWQARERFECGDWTSAYAIAAELSRLGRVAPVARIPAIGTLAALAVRRGESGAGAAVSLALSEAEKTGEHQRIAPLLLAQAEAAWQTGDDEACTRSARSGISASTEHGSLDNLGRFVVWLWRAGSANEARACLDEAPRCPQRFADEVLGRWAEAALEWEARGCAYEQALALSCGSKQDMRQAMSLLEALGARPALAALKVRRPMRGTPPGPRDSTKAHPLGLTVREQEILDCIVRGMSNADIARKLFRSQRTVEHHVSALLGKLGVANRSEAIAKAMRLALADAGRDAPPTASRGPR